MELLNLSYIFDAITCMTAAAARTCIAPLQELSCEILGILRQTP